MKKLIPIMIATVVFGVIMNAILFPPKKIIVEKECVGDLAERCKKLGGTIQFNIMISGVECVQEAKTLFTF